MKLLLTKKYLKTVLLSLCIFSTANALEFRPLVQFEFPTDVTIKKNVEDVKEEREWHSDYVIVGGAEMLFLAEFAPIRYAFGLGFKSAQKDNGHTITPAFLPIWGRISFGAYHKEWPVIPYLTTRVGTMAPLTGDGSWWERPFHYFANVGVGILLPYNFGLEVNYNYSSVRKSFSDQDTMFRVSAGRLGLQLSVGFELTHERKNKVE
ncbi:MAG: hypothetical protein IKS97_10540 [Fibrobacter sp.]|jgi:hypothetical protein|nr:hypothetical protein [Fibrobacter sp.]